MFGTQNIEENDEQKNKNKTKNDEEEETKYMQKVFLHFLFSRLFYLFIYLSGLSVNG